MAQRQFDITIESWGTSDREYKVFSDIYPPMIEKIEGVISVSTLFLDKEGYVIVYIDGRYENKAVLADIRTLQKRITDGEISPRGHS